MKPDAYGRLQVLRDVLDVIPDAAVLVDANDVAIAASSNATSLGLLQSNRLSSVELRAVNREARRQGNTVSKELVVQRSAESLGDWEARVQVSPLEGNIALLIALDLSEARRLNEVRRDFVANVSHELKTPVGAIALLAEAIQAADNDVEQVRHFSSRMQIEVRRLTELVSDLVELSQVQGETPMRKAAPVAVSDIVTEAVDAMKVAAQQRQITLNVAEQLDVGHVFGDRAQLTTALRNLVSNAVNYSPPQTSVGVGARRSGDRIEISVIDQGPGISADDQVRVFERFYRVDPARSRETGGTGLGLAIVKHVCANHGGDCTVWSKQGEGATFTLHLPAFDGQIANDQLGVSV